MKKYSVEEIKSLFTSMTDKEIIGTDALLDSFGATGDDMCLTIHLDDGGVVEASTPQEYDADTDDFYRHWEEIAPALVAEVREKVEVL